MNQNCEGDAFEVEGTPYWRCLKDGTILRGVDMHILRCPHCGRYRRNFSPVEVEVRTVQSVRITSQPQWGWLELPS